MEIWNQNYLTRDTCDLLLEGITVTSENIMRRDPRNQLVSSGFADDTTTTTIRISLNSDVLNTDTGQISRIALLNHNWKQFIVSKSSNKADASNYLTLTSTCQTVTSSWTTNSMTSHYLAFDSVAITSLYIFATKTIVANSEKAIGSIYLADKLLSFPITPSSDNYRMTREQIAVNHELSDGGRRVHILDEKFRTEIAFDYVSSTFRESLKTIYDSHDQLVFVPFEPTSGGIWDTICFPCQWHGEFNFYNFSDNAIDAGNSGSITFLETVI